ncbi:MAG: DJ-1/PfpI family protein [Gammaproteobacteria bacterium]|jgi:4-methyl-5(b-hydroxyethyl)-thiazole monophosphate biosynthesis
MSRVLVPLAQGCEELEAITITDLLVRAGIEVTTAGLDDRPVTASRGTTIVPDTTINAVADQLFDLIVLPGGLPGADHLRDNNILQKLLKDHAATGKPVGAICAAPKALSAAGLLEGKSATAYPGILEALANDRIDIKNSAIEIDGNIITSRGPGTAMDFALTLIELLEGPAKRDEVNRQLAR